LEDELVVVAVNWLLFGHVFLEVNLDIVDELVVICIIVEFQKLFINAELEGTL